MKVFSRGNPEPGEQSDATGEAAASESAGQAIAGDRGIPSINRVRSVQSRMSGVLAMGLMGALSLGLLTWYYARAFTRPARAQHAAQAAARNRAQGDMPLPSLGPIHSPPTRSDGAVPPTPAEATAPDPSLMEQLLGPAPGMPVGLTGVTVPTNGAPRGALDPTHAKSPGELAFERRLAGPAFARSSKEGAQSQEVSNGRESAETVALGPPAATPAADPPANSAQALNGLLRPTVTAAVSPSVLPTRRFLLAKGAFIDCTLETAIDSTLPGMTTCITATDTFSADGSVVLLERGTKLVGETRGQVAQGSARVFVLWTEARTPTGVVVPLASPGTDELGRSGLPGEINRHFWDRFGAAILLTVINGAVQGAVNSQNSGGSVVVSPSTSTDVMSEVLRSTVSIPPTITKAQGDRIQIFVARDVDFRPVYALRIATLATPDKAP